MKNKSDLSKYYFDMIWQRGFEAANKMRDYQANPKKAADASFWNFKVDRKFVLISKEDYLWAMRFNWMFTKSGYLWRNAYDGDDRTAKFLHVEVLARKLKLNYHTLAKKEDWRGTVFFSNGNKWDCRRENLEWLYAGQTQILGKKPKTNTSGIKGVRFDQNRQKWMAQIQFKKKGYMKRFETVEEAKEWRRLMEERFSNL